MFWVVIVSAMSEDMNGQITRIRLYSSVGLVRSTEQARQYDGDIRCCVKVARYRIFKNRKFMI